MTAFKSSTTLVTADILIPGRGDPIRHGALAYTIGGPILWTGKADDVPAEYTHCPRTRVRVLMPGLWDCHVHLTGSADLKLESFILADRTLAGAHIARDVAAMLNAGYTSCREVGGYGYSVAKAIDAGWLPGPHIYSAVSILSQTGGHGDVHSLPPDFVKTQMKDGGPLHMCDGVDECVKAVRLKVREGAKLIKVAASGGVMSLLDDPESVQFNTDELEAIVKEAAKTKKIVAAHCHGKDAILAALNAGCKTIEHGTYLDDECIALMKEKGALLIATRFISDYITSHPEYTPPVQYQKALVVTRVVKAMYAKAVKAGVRCALGADIWTSNIEMGIYPGLNGRELGFAVEAGMSELQAIEAATANGPETLGPQAPRSGQLREGFDADFIALSDNPLDDIGVLATPAKISHVWKGGYLFKKPEHPVGFFPMTPDL